MNRRQKLVQTQFLNNEEAVINRLQQVYGKSLTDIKDKIKDLDFKIGELQEKYDWLDPDDPERAKIKSQIQSKIYQKQYQQQLEKQVGGIFDEMKTKQFTTVSGYLDECYTDGFIGTMFDAHGQGVPIVAPINQESMVRAVQLDSKISKGLYTRLGEDVDLLKKKIMAQVSRSIATNMTYAQTAQQLAGYTKIGYNNAARIARTEGHRIQCTAAKDAMVVAKEKGADVVKQWDATLDGRTRDSHRVVDGEIREVNKSFSNGLDFPGDPDGGAAEVVNCRCALLQRARWALDDAELQTLRDRAAYYGLDKAEEFEDFKRKYLKATEEPVVPKGVNTLGSCKTVSDVENLMREQDWFIHGTGKLEGWRSDDGLSFDGCDIESAKTIYQGFATFFDKYPQMKGKLSAPTTALLGKDTYGQCTMGFGAEGVTVNKFYFKNYERLSKNLLRDAQFGFHPVSDPQSVVVHELGHALDGYLSTVTHLFGTSGKNKSDFVSNKMRPKVMGACGLKVGDIKDSVSEYATKNPHEWFAECTAEYLCSPNPRKVATEFGKQLDEIMKGVK